MKYVFQLGMLKVSVRIMYVYRRKLWFRLYWQYGQIINFVFVWEVIYEKNIGIVIEFVYVIELVDDYFWIKFVYIIEVMVFVGDLDICLLLEIFWYYK